MRLKSVYLKNCGSYAEHTIVLENVKAATVGGGNGKGKSTGLFQAPMWGWFGKCPGSEDLIRLGETDMTVSNVFELHGRDYRVTRSKSIRTKAGKTELQLHVLNGEEWQSIGGATIAETQQKIIDLLHVDYDLLLNTSFFQQGHADKFTAATPGTRKQVLAAILRLDGYGDLKKAAAQSHTKCATQIEEQDKRVRDLEAIADQHPQLEAQEKELAEALQIQQTHQTDLEQMLETHTIRKADFQAKLARLTEHQKNLSEAQSRLKEIATKIVALMEKQHGLTELLSKAEEIRAKGKEQQEVESKIEGCEAELKTVESEIVKLEQEYLEKESQHNKEKSERDTQEKRLVTLRHEADGVIREYHNEMAQYERELERNRKATKTLEVIPYKENCDRCQFTKDAIEAKKRIPEIDLLLKNRIADDKVVFTLNPTLFTNIAEQERQLEETTVVDRTVELGQLRDTLTHQRTLKNTTITAKGAHLDLFKKLKEWTVLIPELESAERERSDIAEALTSLDQDREKTEKHLEELKEQLAEKPVLEQSLSQNEQEMTVKKVELETIKKTIQSKSEVVGTVRQQIKQALDAQTVSKEIRLTIRDLTDETRRYRILTEAYGMIPTLIFENALPVLEAEANRILQKITATGMQVTFVTQKALKSRDGLSETLDIRIRDVDGERVLERYSGGERGRIDLAVRIALSRLLATRAGAHIETMVLDESFAAIDPNGIHMLSESLGVLTENFPLVLIITHDERLKYALPTQIEVTRNGSGSVVNIRNN